MPDEPMTKDEWRREMVRAVASQQPAQREARKVLALERIADALEHIKDDLRAFRANEELS